VDNASTDDTVSIVHEFPKVMCLQLDRNIGFGKANNVGFRRAMDDGAHFVFLLNQDAYIKEDTIELLVKYAQHDGSYGVLSPLHLNGDGSHFDARFLSYAVSGSSDIFFDLYQGTLKEIYPTDFVNAAAWLITRKCLETVGGFDPLFHMYGEDADYCVRVHQCGLKVGLVPSAVAMHSRMSGPQQYESSWDRRWSNLTRMSDRVKNRSVLALKEPSRSFGRQFASITIDRVRDFLQALLDLNLHYAAVVTLGYFKTFKELPKIRRHRKISLRPGPNWLQLEDGR